MLLSVIIPVYNERLTLGTILRVVARTLPDVSKEIIVVDDCSKDGTRERLKANFPDGARSGSSVDLDHDGQLVFAQEFGPGAHQHPPDLSRAQQRQGRRLGAILNHCLACQTSATSLFSSCILAAFDTMWRTIWLRIDGEGVVQCRPN